MAPSGLYARLCHAFLVFNDRLLDLVAENIMYLSWIGRRMEGLANLVYHFAIPQATLPWPPIL